MKLSKFFITFLVTVCTLTTLGNTTEILALLGVKSKHHQIWAESILTELIQYYNITIATVQPRLEKLQKASYVYFEEVPPTIKQDLEANELPENYIPKTNFENFQLWKHNIELTCEGILKSNGFDEILKLGYFNKTKYDFIIYDGTYGESCLLSVAHMYPKAPIIVIAPTILTPPIFDMANSGSINAGSVPFFLTDFSERMNILQRGINVLFYAGLNFFHQYYHYFHLQLLLNFNSYAKAANISNEVVTLRNRIKIILANINPVTDYSHSLPPNIIPVGGLHIEDAKKLPRKIIEQFNAKKGVVYINIPALTVTDILKVRHRTLINIIQRNSQYLFVWRVKPNSLGQKLPANLIARIDLKENDVLAHEKTMVMMTEAEPMNVQSALYHNVAVLVFPFANYQPNVAKRVVERGIGMSIDYESFDENDIEDALDIMLRNQEFKKKLKQLSLAFRMGPNKPLKTAVYWIRATFCNDFSGVKYKFSILDNNVNFWRTHYIDLIIIIEIIIVSALILAYKLWKNDVRRCLARSKLFGKNNTIFGIKLDSRTPSPESTPISSPRIMPESESEPIYYARPVLESAAPMSPPTSPQNKPVRKQQKRNRMNRKKRR